MKNSKFLIGILVLFIVVLSVMLGMNIKVYINRQNEIASKKITQKVQNEENVEKKFEKVEPEKEQLEDWQIECKEEHVPYGYG
ncbi:MAG: hypothetical protein U0J50_07965, partial [Peptacetobacter hiranonis]|nr:hypothetical protein [Peptacetobacter hiranonis]